MAGLLERELPKLELPERDAGERDELWREAPELNDGPLRDAPDAPREPMSAPRCERPESPRDRGGAAGNP
jgi:hypothetical protein